MFRKRPGLPPPLVNKWLIKPNYGLLWTYPRSIHFTAPIPAPLDTLHRQVTSAPEDLNGNNSRFGAVLSFPVSKAMLNPAAQNSHSDGPHARAAPSVGNAEGLVKVQVRDIRPKVSRTTDAHLPQWERANSQSQELEKVVWRGGPSPWRKGRQSCSQARPPAWLRPAGKPGIP